MIVALSPLNCKLSTPFFTNPNAPTKPPEKLVSIGLDDLVVTPLNVNVPDVLDIVPAPAIVPMVSEKPAKSNTPVPE